MAPLFLPPFDVRAGSYHGLSYRGHSAYSVDFNRGTWTDDLGDWVLCSSPGSVRSLDRPYGGVLVSHPDGWESWYYHLGRIDVVVGQELRQGEKIGTVGRTYPGARVLSPHLHVNHLHGGQRVQVVYGGVPYPASQLNPSGIVVGPLITGQCPFDAGVAAR